MPAHWFTGQVRTNILGSTPGGMVMKAYCQEVPQQNQKEASCFQASNNSLTKINCDETMVFGTSLFNLSDIESYNSYTFNSV